VAVLFFVVHERQLHRPVVRQIQIAPLRSVKLLRGKPQLAGLGEVSLTHAKSKIAQGIAGVSLKKLPVKVEQQMLARRDRGLGLRRSCAGIGCEQRMGAPDGTGGQG
jgi:hypothetical protein